MKMEFVISAAAAVAFASVQAAVYNVRDFGAKGDGVSKDTAAIQQAIDRATAAGGGTVEVPAGTFISGTIWLKSNVDFFLCAGATLLGSPDKEDYNPPDAFPQNSKNDSELNSGAHLVLCVEQKNVVVRGPGCINGNGPRFVLDKDGKRFPFKWRPGQMLFFVESEDIRIENVKLLNSAYWTCFVHGCTRVSIRGVYIKNHFLTYNGDGIDLDCCQYVTISDCVIHSSDDCITLRGSGRRLKKPQDMAFVAVNNCILRNNRCNGIRIGVGDRDIHDAVFSNIIVEEARTAIMAGNGYTNPSKPEKVRGTGVSNMRFENFHVKHAREMCLLLAQCSSGATMESVHFANIDAKTDRASRLYGNAAFPFKDVSFVNVRDASGVEAVNVDGLSVDGGSFKEKALSPEERARISDDVTNFRNIIW